MMIDLTREQTRRLSDLVCQVIMLSDELAAHDKINPNSRNSAESAAELIGRMEFVLRDPQNRLFLELIEAKCETARVQQENATSGQ